MELIISASEYRAISWLLFDKHGKYNTSIRVGGAPLYVLTGDIVELKVICDLLGLSHSNIK